MYLCISTYATHTAVYDHKLPGSAKNIMSDPIVDFIALLSAAAAYGQAIGAAGLKPIVVELKPIEGGDRVDGVGPSHRGKELLRNT